MSCILHLRPFSPPSIPSLTPSTVSRSGALHYRAAAADVKNRRSNQVNLLHRILINHSLYLPFRLQKGAFGCAFEFTLSHRPTRKTLQNIAQPTTIASNIPVHAQPLAPFCHRRILLLPAKQQKQTKYITNTNARTQKRNIKIRCVPPAPGWRTAAKDLDAVALLHARNRVPAAIPE